jgi:hypothetical protein
MTDHDDSGAAPVAPAGVLGPQEILRYEIVTSRGGLPPGAKGMAPTSVATLVREVTQAGPGPWQRVDVRSKHKIRLAVRWALGMAEATDD